MIRDIFEAIFAAKVEEPVPVANPPRLIGVDPHKMLDTTTKARDRAETRRTEIIDEIARLNGELANTELAIKAATAAVDVLVAHLDIDLGEDFAAETQALPELAPTTHTSNERRIEEYANAIQAVGRASAAVSRNYADEIMNVRNRHGYDPLGPEAGAGFRDKVEDDA